MDFCPTTGLAWLKRPKTGYGVRPDSTPDCRSGFTGNRLAPLLFHARVSAELVSQRSSRCANRTRTRLTELETVGRIRHRVLASTSPPGVRFGRSVSHLPLPAPICVRSDESQFPQPLRQTGRDTMCRVAVLRAFDGSRHGIDVGSVSSHTLYSRNKLYIAI